MDANKPSRAYMPRSTAANAIEWELPGGGVVASSSRQRRQSPTSPLARLSTIMASVRSSLVGQPPGDEEIGAAHTHVYYNEDKIGGSSSDDDGRLQGKGGKAGVHDKINSLRAVSSLESLSVVQQRREEQRAQRQSTQEEDDQDESRFGRLSAALQRRRRVVLMAAGALVALILVIGLGAGLGLRAARSRELLLAGSGSATAPTSTSALLPAHPTATPIALNVTSSANATSQTSTSSSLLPSSSVSSNSSTILPPTSSTTPPAVVPPSTTPAPTQPSSTPAPPPQSTTPPPTTPAPSPDPTPTPAPATAPAPAPSPEPAPAPAPAPVPVPAPPVTPSSGSPNGGPFAGDVTFYAPGLGACGRYNAATDYIAAVSESLYDSVAAAHGISNPNANPLCGRRIRVTLSSSVGATVDVTIVDRCTACAENDVDLSPSAFGQLAGASMGRVRGTWFFLD